MHTLIVLVSFWLLGSLTFLRQRARARALQRNTAEWTLDVAGLLVQGLVVPALQITLAYGLLSGLAPAAKASLDLAPALAFLLNFVAVDYLYYWNHRALHTPAFWKTHAVHHTPEQADVFITSRNTLWTPLLIVYVWANGLMIFLLKDPLPFLWSASITASLDLWRHTTFITAPGSAFHRALAGLLVTPNEHLWHHSRERAGCNFGANLSLWDRLHGTYYSPAARPSRLGIPVQLALPRKLLFPFRAASEEPPR